MMAFDNKAYMREYNYRPEVKARRKEYSRWSAILRKYGITKLGVWLMWRAQGDKCFLCGESLGGFDSLYHIDHDHKTGMIRGLLHNKCNQMLGQADDDPKLLRKGADYLEAANE